MGTTRISQRVQTLPPRAIGLGTRLKFLAVSLYRRQKRYGVCHNDGSVRSCVSVRDSGIYGGGGGGGGGGIKLGWGYHAYDCVVKVPVFVPIDCQGVRYS